MLESDSYREFRNGKGHKRNPERTMSENGSIEESRAGNSSENAEEEIPKIHTLSREAVSEQIKGFVAPLTRQLEELTRLVQGMVTTPHCPRTDYSTISGTAAQPDKFASDNLFIMLA